MFGKAINTKVDHAEIFRKAIDAAIDQAKTAHVSSGTIIQHLKMHAEQHQPQWRHPGLGPKTYDSYGREIDLGAQAQKAREARKARADSACEIDPSQRQRAASGYRVR
jgi:hypothetical protein